MNNLEWHTKTTKIARKWLIGAAFYDVCLSSGGTELKLALQVNSPSNDPIVELKIRGSWQLCFSSTNPPESAIEREEISKLLEFHYCSKDFPELCSTIAASKITDASISANGSLQITFAHDRILCIDGKAGNTQNSEFEDQTTWQLTRGAHKVFSCAGKIGGVWDPYDFRFKTDSERKAHYEKIFWIEKFSLAGKRAHTFRQILEQEIQPELELLPVSELKAAFCEALYAVEMEDKVFWRSGFGEHQIIFEKQFFYYECTKKFETDAQIADWEYMKIPAIAGKFGCTAYHPNSDQAFTRLQNSIIKEPRVLHTHPNGSSAKALQLPASVTGLQKPTRFDGDIKLPSRISFDGAVATIDRSIDELERLSGLIFEDGVDDLGELRFAIVEIENDHFQLIRHLYELPGVYVEMESDCKSAGESLDTLLIAFGLTSKDLDWRHPSLTFTPHELWRQDDNGNEALIETCVCRADALEKARIFTDRGHKQLYWVTSVK